MDYFMKIRIALGLCLVLGGGSISLRAADNPAQAAARAALIQKLNELDGPQTQSLPTTNTPSEAVVEQPGKSAGSVTETVPENAVTPQTAPVATTPAAAPVAVAPAKWPATLLLVFIALLLIALVVTLILLLKLRALKLRLQKDPAVMARAAEASRSHGSKRNSTGA